MKNTFTMRRAALLALLLTLVLCLFCACRTEGDPADGSLTVESVTDGAPTEPSESGPSGEPDTTPESTPETQPAETLPDIICGNEELVYSYTDEQYASFGARVQQLVDLLAANDPARTDEFITLYEDIEDNDYALLEDQYLIAEVQSMIHVNDESAAALFADVSALYHEKLKELIMLYDDIYESVYSEKFYEEWTQEDVEQAVMMAKSYTDRLSELKTQYDALKTEFYALPQDDYLNATAELYMRAVALNKEIAREAGFDNYMDYAYLTSYGREYTPADVQQMRDYVKEYVVPQITVLLGRIRTLSQSVGNDALMTYALYMDASLPQLGLVDGLGTPDARLQSALSGYYTAMGGSMLDAFNEQWSQNRFIVARNVEVSRAGAFSVYFNTLKYPLFYFGPGYDSMYTIIHEAGHCYAMKLSGTGDMPIDLAEVHSQGSEWLFTSHLRGSMSAEAFELLADYRLFNDFCSICNCASVDAFEQYIYSHDGYTAADLDGIMTEIMKEMGIYNVFTQVYANPVSYWHYVTTDNPAYYISYAMSMVPSLSLFAMSLDDFPAAAAAYQDICVVGEFDTFLGVLSRAGISSPFEEQTYQTLSGIVKTLSKLK